MRSWYRRIGVRWQSWVSSQSIPWSWGDYQSWSWLQRQQDKGQWIQGRVLPRNWWSQRWEDRRKWETNQRSDRCYRCSAMDQFEDHKNILRATGYFFSLIRTRYFSSLTVNIIFSPWRPFQAVQSVSQLREERLQPSISPYLPRPFPLRQRSKDASQQGNPSLDRPERRPKQPRRESSRRILKKILV